MRKKYEYEVYSCGNAGAEIYVGKTDGLREGERRTVPFDGDILLDIVWATDEEEAVAAIAETEDVSPDTLYAIQHVADAFLSGPDVFKAIRAEAAGYREDEKFGFEITLPEGRNVRLEFDSGLSMRIVETNPNGEERTGNVVFGTPETAVIPKTQDPGGWTVTDIDSFQICRKLKKMSEECGESVFELYQLQVVPGSKTEKYMVAHEIVFFRDIDIESVLECYGYGSIEDVVAQYGDEWAQILAECSFELSSSNLENIISSPMSYEEGILTVRRSSGYWEGYVREEERDDAGIGE